MTSEVKVFLPDDVKEIIERLRLRGDYVEISRLLAGDDTRTRDVGQAILTGYGPADLIESITSFYRSRQRITEKLNAL